MTSARVLSEPQLHATQEASACLKLSINVTITSRLSFLLTVMPRSPRSVTAPSGEGSRSLRPRVPRRLVRRHAQPLAEYLDRVRAEPRGRPPHLRRRLRQPVRRGGVLRHAEVRMVHLQQE